MRILIAEDEVTIARALKAMLEKNRYAVDMVHNGTDALDYIRAISYDALVLDTLRTAAPANSRIATASISQPMPCAPRKRSFLSGIAARFSFSAEPKKRLS